MGRDLSPTKAKMILITFASKDKEMKNDRRKEVWGEKL